jgi:hypothetical protein
VYALEPWLQVAGGRVWAASYLFLASATFEAWRGWKDLKPSN